MTFCMFNRANRERRWLNNSRTRSRLGPNFGQIARHRRFPLLYSFACSFVHLYVCGCVSLLTKYLSAVSVDFIGDPRHRQIPKKAGSICWRRVETDCDICYPTPSRWITLVSAIVKSFLPLSGCLKEIKTFPCSEWRPTLSIWSFLTNSHSKDHSFVFVRTFFLPRGLAISGLEAGYFKFTAVIDGTMEYSGKVIQLPMAWTDQEICKPLFLSYAIQVGAREEWFGSGQEPLYLSYMCQNFAVLTSKAVFEWEFHPSHF